MIADYDTAYNLITIYLRGKNEYDQQLEGIHLFQHASPAIEGIYVAIAQNLIDQSRPRYIGWFSITNQEISNHQYYDFCCQYGHLWLYRARFDRVLEVANVKKISNPVGS